MSLADCIEEVCTEAEKTKRALAQIKIDGQSILNEVGEDNNVFECVINGPAGTFCQTSSGVVHLTLAEALTRLNALSINSIVAQSFTATSGQTDFTLGTSIPNPAALEVELNGVMCSSPRDWNVSGNILSFVYPLTAGDKLDLRKFNL